MPALHVIDDRPAPALWSVGGRTRIERQLARLGAVFDAASGDTLLLRSDAVYDLSVLKGLLATPGVMLIGEAGEALAAHARAEDVPLAESWLRGLPVRPPLRAVGTAEIGDSYNAQLRKKELPFAALVKPENARSIEWRLFQGSYKGVTDLVTKYLWPVPASHVTRVCARLGVTPNMVTALSALCVIAAYFRFTHADYAVGLLAAWLMTFLDTVDGKLARVTLKISKLGNAFDHGIDLLHPPFWYMAWGLGLAASGHALPAGWLAPLIAVIFAFYITGRLIEGYFIKRFGIELHVWRRFDSRFRLIVARRNPNLILLTLSLFARRPDLGFLAVAGWTAAGVLIHLAQVAQAEIARRQGRAIVSWLAQ